VFRLLRLIRLIGEGGGGEGKADSEIGAPGRVLRLFRSIMRMPLDPFGPLDRLGTSTTLRVCNPLGRLGAFSPFGRLRVCNRLGVRFAQGGAGLASAGRLGSRLRVIDGMDGGGGTGEG
jgi:hypothetical protein